MISAAAPPDELRRQLTAALPHGLKNIRRGDRHRELDDERAGGIVRIAQQVGEHRARGPPPAPPYHGPQHPRREQHGAVAEVDVALHGRGHLDDHRHHGAEGGEPAPARTSLRNFISVMKIISKKVLHFCLVCILIRIGLNKSIKSIYFHRTRLEMPMLTYDLDRARQARALRLSLPLHP